MQFYEYILEGIFRIDEASNCVNMLIKNSKFTGYS